MKKNIAAPVLLIAYCLLMAATILAYGQSKPPVDKQFKTRCGWYENPTPNNVWLADRDGEWTIETQGGHHIDSPWEAPNFKRGQWVKTNREYGYGCACMRVRVNYETMEVVEIDSSQARPLATCRRDPALKKL